MPKCKCNLEAKRVQVKKEGPNKGRWFFTCPKPAGEQCEYFEWEKREPINEVEINSKQYQSIMRALTIINDNLKAISKELFRKGYIPVWEGEDNVREPKLNAPNDEIDKINAELAGVDEEEKKIDLSSIPF